MEEKKFISHVLKTGFPAWDYKPEVFDLQFEKTDDPRINKMADAVNWYINDIVFTKNVPYWLTLSGSSGIGKTHLAYMIDSHVSYRTNRYTCRLPWIFIANTLRNGEYAIKDQLKEASVLVLDDIGAENTTEFLRGALYEILNARLGKWTVITTNLAPNQIRDDFDFRIASRLFRGNNVICYVPNAKDYAFTKKFCQSQQEK